jgi:hypothetical protein
MSPSWFLCWGGYCNASGLLDVGKRGRPGHVWPGGNRVKFRLLIWVLVRPLTSLWSDSLAYWRGAGAKLLRSPLGKGKGEGEGEGRSWKFFGIFFSGQEIRGPPLIFFLCLVNSCDFLLIYFYFRHIGTNAWFVSLDFRSRRVFLLVLLWIASCSFRIGDFSWRAAGKVFSIFLPWWCKREEYKMMPPFFVGA